MICEDIIQLLEKLSPIEYACDWDNVGLLVGRRKKEIHRIMVALDATKEVVQDAIDKNVDMLITHHPMIFSSIKRVTEGDFTQEKVLELAEHGICYYAMHTNFDAVGGMADLVVSREYLNLSEVSPIEPCNALCVEEKVGMGRYGMLPKPMTASELAEYVKERFHLPFVLLYQSPQKKDQVYERIAVLPGSGKSEMRKVLANGYNIYLTGDFGHHDGVDAIDMGLTVIDATHYGLEHIFIKYMCNYLNDKLKGCDVSILETTTKAPVKVL